MQLAHHSENQEELLEKIIDHLPASNQPTFSIQFDADIRDLLESFKTQSYFGLTIEDTDDLNDLFVCGTEVEGSCQNIDRNPELNKCLLAYIADGKNRLVAIKDMKGKIRARAILRILWNPEIQQPVLFLERIYPAILPLNLVRRLKNLRLEEVNL